MFLICKDTLPGIIIWNDVRCRLLCSPTSVYLRNISFCLLDKSNINTLRRRWKFPHGLCRVLCPHTTCCWVEEWPQLIYCLWALQTKAPQFICLNATFSFTAHQSSNQSFSCKQNKYKRIQILLGILNMKCPHCSSLSRLLFLSNSGNVESTIFLLNDLNISVFFKIVYHLFWVSSMF